MTAGDFAGRKGRLSLKITVPVLSFLGALALCSPALQAQDPVFKSGIDMVPLTVTVTDPAGKYVGGLKADDFTVFEDGVAQRISFFAREEVPIDVALMVDTSASMSGDLPLVRSAAISLIQQLRTADRSAVVEIKDSPRVTQSLTGDRALLEHAIHNLSSSGSTALYDGLYVVLREFQRERRGTADVRRQAVVLLSDGLDTHSRLTFDDVIDLTRRAGVNIYVIALRGDTAIKKRSTLDDSVLDAEYAMGAVARETGGRTFFPKSARELSSIYNVIAQELASQYAMGYVPLQPGDDGKFRHVSVRLRPETNALARTRTGYYARRVLNGL